MLNRTHTRTRKSGENNGRKNYKKEKRKKDLVYCIKTVILAGLKERFSSIKLIIQI